MEQAHARILEIDVSAAVEFTGVLAIITYPDLDGALQRPLPVLLPHQGLSNPRTQYALAADEIRYVGETIAMVVATDRYIAEDAVSAVHVHYEPRPEIVDLAVAADQDEHLAGSFSEETGDVSAAMAAAPHVFEWVFDIQRSAGMPMETRAVSASYDATEDRLVVYDTTQSPAAIRGGLAALLEMEPDRVHVVAPDVGGGFGTKGMQFYPEEVLIPWAARRLGFPIKWTEDRREHFIGSNHERRQIHNVRVGCDDAGRILALETHFLHDSGAYCPFGLTVPVITAAQLPGPYKLQNYAYRLQAIYTHTVPVSPYRGAGRPQAVFVMERVLDRVAGELGLDRAEVRRRNFVTPESYPYNVGVTFQDGNAIVYDSGNYPKGFQLLMERIGYSDFASASTEAAAANRRLGIGFACYVEGTGIGPYESAALRIHPDGRITVVAAVGSQGQGHETTLAQIAANVLEVNAADVSVTTGDTRVIDSGAGTYASRTAVVAGHAVHEASLEVRRKAVELAARLFEGNPEDIEISGGHVQVHGAPQSRISLGELAALANPLRYSFGEDSKLAATLAQRASARRDRPLPDGESPGLEAVAHYSPLGAVFGFGMHAAVVEVNTDTYSVHVHRYVVVHDCGTMINPLIVQGQVTGGVAQGIGGALYEHLAYDEHGQLQNASFMDFLIPYATELPRPVLHHLETPSPNNLLGIKGVGEAGIIPVSAAINNALADALGGPMDRSPVSPLDLFCLED